MMKRLFAWDLGEAPENVRRHAGDETRGTIYASTERHALSMLMYRLYDGGERFKVAYRECEPHLHDIIAEVDANGQNPWERNLKEYARAEDSKSGDQLSLF